MGTPTDNRWERSEFSSTDAEESREFLDRVYGWRMGEQRPGRPGRPLTISMVGTDALATADAVAPGDLSYAVTGSDFYVFDTLLQGEFELQHSRGTDRHRRGDVFIANHPDADFLASTHDIKVVTTMLPAAVLDEVAHLDPDTDASPVHFDSLTPRTGAAARWRAASRYADSLLGGAPPSPLLTRATARQLAAVALETFPNDALDAASHVSHDGDAHPEALRRAIAFIESNPDVHITLVDIARAASVGPRAVQLAIAATSTPRPWPMCAESASSTPPPTSRPPLRVTGRPSPASPRTGGSTVPAASLPSTGRPTATRRATRSAAGTGRTGDQRARHAAQYVPRTGSDVRFVRVVHRPPAATFLAKLPPLQNRAHE